MRISSATFDRKLEDGRQARDWTRDWGQTILAACRLCSNRNAWSNIAGGSRDLLLARFCARCCRRAGTEGTTIQNPSSWRKKIGCCRERRQAAGTADHLDFDSPAKASRLRRQRPVRGVPCLYWYARSLHTNGRVQRHSKTKIPPLQHL